MGADPNTLADPPSDQLIGEDKEDDGTPNDQTVFENPDPAGRKISSLELCILAPHLNFELIGPITNYCP